MKCQIQWIDCKGTPTPDNNEAVGFAVLADRKFPVCADHAKGIGYNWSHHSHDDVRCTHRSSDPAHWTFEPLASAQLGA